MIRAIVVECLLIISQASGWAAKKLKPSDLSPKSGNDLVDDGFQPVSLGVMDEDIDLETANTIPAGPPEDVLDGSLRSRMKLAL